MLPKANHLCRVIGVQLIQRSFNALVSKARNVRRIGKTSLSIDDNVNEPISNFDLWRNVQKFAQMFHSDPLATATSLALQGQAEPSFKSLQSFNFTIGCKA